MTIGAAAMMLLCAPLAKPDASYLPIVQKNGENCYYYSVERGESVYGIVKRFDWDAEVFMRYNPNASELKGGQVVYYPCVVKEKKDEPDRTKEQTPAETSKKAPQTSLSIPASKLTDSKPSETPKAAVAVQARQTRPASEIKSEPMDLNKVKSTVYSVKESDSLVNVLRSSNTGIKSLFRGNPGLTPDNFAPGIQIKLFPGTDVECSAYREVPEKVRSGQKIHKVKQKDTWESIAKKSHIEVRQLREANPGVEMLQKGLKLAIPQFKDSLVHKWVPVEDPRMNSDAGIREVYKEAHQRLNPDGTKKSDQQLDIAVLVSCDDAVGRRRDLEFLRGFMLGLEGKGNAGTKINLKGADLADYGSLALALKSGDFDNMDIITCSVDKNFPEELVKFCDDRNILLLNIFDARTDISAMSPQGVQLLPPSDYFYDRASDFLTRVMKDRTFIFVDYDVTDDDNMSGAMMQRLKDRGITRIVNLPDADALAGYDFNPLSSYTVISDAGTKANIDKTLKVLEEIVDTYPNMPLTIVGRPGWMVYSQSLEPLLRKLDTYIPSRFLFDSDSESGKTFEEEFKAFFKSAPLNSMPMYSVMGNDVARYFIDQYIKTDGDLNYAQLADSLMQLDFRLDRPQMWSGFMNRRVYLLHFTPFSTTDRISL